MARQYLVVSDLHLCDIEDHPDGWKAYKSKKFCFDPQFDDLIKRFMNRNQSGDRLVLILNGDIIDFDLVTTIPEKSDWSIGWLERRSGLNPTEPKSIWVLEKVLNDHPGFVRTLAEFLSAGGDVVYVIGNHDREFYFHGVQQTFITAIQRCAQELNLSFSEQCIRFEDWFYYVPGEIYAEHGHQYEHFSSFRYVLSPTVTFNNEKVIALPMGNLSNRYLISRMGFFNPHSGDFFLNLFSYLSHWLEKYAFTRRSLLFNWMWGSILVMSKLLKIRKQLLFRPPGLAALLHGLAGRFHIKGKTLRFLYRLQRPPVTSRFFRIIREFWIDRVVIFLGMVGGTIALALAPVPLWIKLMVPLSSFPLLYFVYESLIRKENIHTFEKQFPDMARRISLLLPVKVITFGHTHTPKLIPISKQVTYVDTGSWAPIMDKKNPEKLSPGLRNYLLVSFAEEPLHLHLGSWISASEPRRKITNPRLENRI